MCHKTSYKNVSLRDSLMYLIEYCFRFWSLASDFKWWSEIFLRAILMNTFSLATNEGNHVVALGHCQLFCPFTHIMELCAKAAGDSLYSSRKYYLVSLLVLNILKAWKYTCKRYPKQRTQTKSYWKFRSISSKYIYSRLNETMHGLG